VNYDCRTLGGILDERSHCYTLEVSFYSYTTTSSSATVTQPYTEEACIFLVYFSVTAHQQCVFDKLLEKLMHKRL